MDLNFFQFNYFTAELNFHFSIFILLLNRFFNITDLQNKIYKTRFIKQLTWLKNYTTIKDISDDETKLHIQSDSVSKWGITFKTVPSHMQVVERCVKLVTNASAKGFWR